MNLVHSGGAYLLARASTLIGTDPGQADLVLSDARVSALHALVVRDADGLMIFDLRSTNGLKVNGRPVARARLATGDVISLGGVPVQVQATSDATARRATTVAIWGEVTCALTAPGRRMAVVRGALSVLLMGLKADFASGVNGTAAAAIVRGEVPLPESVAGLAWDDGAIRDTEGQGLEIDLLQSGWSSGKSELKTWGREHAAGKIQMMRDRGSSIATPLVHRGTRVGALCVSTRLSTLPLTADDHRLVDAVAPLFAAVLYRGSAEW